MSRTTSERQRLVKTLTLYSRADCHLCELLLDELRTLIDANTQVQIVDISEDPELTRRFGLRIPILTSGDEEISGYPLNQARVRQALDTYVAK